MENPTQLSESYETKYEHYAHSVGTLMFHVQWCTKYRYKMFQKPETAKLLEACIRRTATRNKIKIIEINVQAEHIHAIVLVDFTFSVSKVLQILKGGSAKLFFEYKEKACFRYLRGHLWSQRKLASSVGFVELSTVRNYLINQDEHHHETTLAEGDSTEGRTFRVLGMSYSFFRLIIQNYFFFIGYVVYI